MTIRRIQILFAIGIVPLCLIILAVNFTLPTKNKAHAQAFNHIVVNSTADNLSACIIPGIMCLRDAITTANGSDLPVLITFNFSGTINLNANAPMGAITWITVNNPNAPITIDASEQQIVLDGNYVTRIFTVHHSSLTLNNITFRFGEGDANAVGGIYSDHSILTINNSQFARNSGGYSGAIYNDGGTLTINNSTFTGNFASVSGGGINNSDGITTVSYSTFFNNDASAGGSISCDRGKIIVQHSILLNNTSYLSLLGSGHDDGAISNNAGCTAIISDTLIEGNAGNASSAMVSNGGIYNGGIMLITRSTISHNQNNDCGGGGIRNDGILSVNYSQLISNSTCGSGGAIITNGILSITNSILSDNHATKYGGGIEIENGISLIFNSTFSNNVADIAGGSLFLRHGLDLIIKNNIMNSAVGF